MHVRMLVLTVAVAACAPTPAPSPPATASLLGDGAGELAPTEQEAIASLLGFELSAEGVLVDGTCGEPVHVEHVHVRDLDQDGTPEILFLGGNTCTSGGTGQSVLLFVRDGDSGYRVALNLPAAAYELLERPAGMPDVRLVGMRPCAGVWRWTGTDYDHERNEPLEPGGCDL